MQLSFFQIPVVSSAEAQDAMNAFLRSHRVLSRRHAWFAKLDVVHYFDTIDHAVLRGQLRRLFKDSLLIAYFDRLIDGYQPAEAIW